MVKVGDEAPDFELKDQNGDLVKLSQLKGKKIILYFYPKDDTAGCTKEAIGFTDSLSAIEDKNALVMGISADSVASHKKFQLKYKLKVTLLADPEKKAIEAYGVWQRKLRFGIPRMGIVRTTVVINESGKVETVWENVKIDGHVETVCNRL